jgi:hypothetical protein
MASPYVGPRGGENEHDDQERREHDALEKRYLLAFVSSKRRGSSASIGESNENVARSHDQWR